jgi:hypothetical protein
MLASRSGPFALVALLLAAMPAAAQNANAVEVTPYVALGSAGASPVGTLVTFPVSETISVESEVAYRRGEGKINALSSNLSLLYSLPRVGRSTPYVAGGVGLAQYGVPVFSAGGSLTGTQSRLRVAMNVGGGLKTPINDGMAWRTDVRWFKGLSGGAEQFRVAQGIAFGGSKK